VKARTPFLLGALQAFLGWNLGPFDVFINQLNLFGLVVNLVNVLFL